jgi:glutamate-1-semialdehyde aminotransferase
VPDRYDVLAGRAERLRTAVAAWATRTGVAARLDTVASLFQIRLGNETAASAVVTGTGAADLFVGLLLEGFYLAPRGMGAIATPATDADVDELAAAIVRVAAQVAETRTEARSG